MKDLKTLLFKKTAVALKEYQEARKECPECDWEVERRTFVVLFNLVEESGLEDEYYAWKEANKDSIENEEEEDF